MGDETATGASTETLQARVAELESALLVSNNALLDRDRELARARSERDKLREAWQAVKFELELRRARVRGAQ